MRFISGIQPTGKLHIGNYFGAIKEWVALQDNHESLVFIADLHALSAPYEPKEYATRTLETVAYLLACGIDPEKTILFIQSAVPEHTELFWYLNTVTAIGDLERMHQYKDKVKTYKKNPNAGLLTYPILQAADILLYNADKVPVGKDQAQHIELTRELAKRFNTRYNAEIFTVPEPHLNTHTQKIMALDEPTKKMSKSSPAGCIFLDDSEHDIIAKVKRAVTDSGSTITFNQTEKPGIASLLTLYSTIKNITVKQGEQEFKGVQYGAFKESVGTALASYLAPIREKFNELKNNPTYIETLIEKNNDRARDIAVKKIKQIRQAIGLAR